MNNFDVYIFQSFLDPDEKIENVIHKHWFALLKAFSKTTLFGIIVPILLISMFPTAKIVLVGMLWCMIGIGYFVYNFFDWYLDAILLTNEYILDIEWNGFFHKLANRIKYEYLESVSYDIQGALPTFLGFGSLQIYTHHEGEKGLKYCADVRAMQKLVLNKRDEILARVDTDDAETLKKALKAFIKEGGMLIEEKKEKEEKTINERRIWVAEKRKIK